MALSFGRKKGEATNEEDQSTSQGANGANAPAPNRSGARPVEEAIDESWFDAMAEEAAANPLPATPTAAQADFSVPPSAPQADFSVFSTDEPEDFGDFGTQVDIPAQATASPMNSSVFVDPAGSGTSSAGASTPFDMSPNASPPSESPKKEGGGLKKILPVLLVLIIVGGGGAFWYSQQPHDEENAGAAAITPATGAMPTGAAPTGAAPTGAAPTGVAPITASSGVQPNPAVKAQLKKLWDEGLILRKQKNDVAAKAKWGAAVRLARSKPGFEKSAAMIQQAIDKIK